jgi:hypothetical protein
MNAWRHVAPLLAVGVLAADGCGAKGSNSLDGLAGNGAASPSEDAGSSSAGGSASGAGSSGSSSGATSLPPEMKVENKFKAPVATGNFVWTANPTSGRVAYINAATFNVQTTPAGNGPTYLAAVADAQHPTDDVAIVLNVLSQDATLLRVGAHGALTTETYPSTTDANSWAISPSGHWGIAWTDATFVDNPDPTQGFQFVAVMDLSATTTDPLRPGPSSILAVGFRPVEVAFSSDDSRAYAVTEDGISVIDLKGGTPTVMRQDPLSAASNPAPADAGGDAAAPDAATLDGAAPDAATLEAGSQDGSVGDEQTAAGSGDDAAAVTTPVATGAPDVSFTPDGSYALARRDGLASITIDSLADGTLTAIPLPSAPTDLTVSPAGDFAVAVLRDTSSVVLFPIPGVVGNPGAITTIPVAGPTVGRAIVTNHGKSVVLFTTVAPVESITVLDLGSSPAARTLPLHAPVQAVFPSSDGQYAIVLHQVTANTGSTAQGAFSVVPIGQKLPAVIQSLPAPPTAVAVSNDRAIVAIRQDSSSTYGLYMALMPSLDVRQYALASPPIAVGIAAGAGRGYAAQDYAEGRITFVDLTEGGPPDGGGGFSAITITGFELNAGIVVGAGQ